MTKSELIARQSKLKRSAATGTIAFLVIFIGVLIGNRWLALFMDRGDRPLALHILYGICFFGFLVAALWFAIWSAQRRDRRFGMMCPTCGKTISGVLAHIAVASDRCGYCGTRLFPDDPKA